jgi:hypothetical protein
MFFVNIDCRIFAPCSRPSSPILAIIQSTASLPEKQLEIETELMLCVATGTPVWGFVISIRKFFIAVEIFGGAKNWLRGSFVSGR